MTYDAQASAAWLHPSTLERAEKMWKTWGGSLVAHTHKPGVVGKVEAIELTPLRAGDTVVRLAIRVDDGDLVCLDPSEVTLI